jgi:hypothetical protein
MSTTPGHGFDFLPKRLPTFADCHPSAFTGTFTDAGSARSVFTPEIITPAQVDYGQQRTPEQELFAAVFYDALHGLTKPPKKGDRSRALARQRQLDLDWILSEDTDWPLSFLNVCAVLGVEPGRLQAWARMLKDGTAPSLTAPPIRSRYRGVYWNKTHQRWNARIGKNEHVGYYRTEEEAARAFDAAMRERGGQNLNPARLNFPNGHGERRAA